MPRENEKAKIERLLAQYNRPSVRGAAEDWEETRAALEAAAAKYGLQVPWRKRPARKSVRLSVLGRA